MFIESSADIDEMLVDTLTEDQMRELGLQFIKFMSETDGMSARSIYHKISLYK